MADYSHKRKEEERRSYSDIRERARRYGEAMDRAHYLRMERTFGRGGHGKSRPVGEQIEGHEKFVANTKRFEEEKRKKDSKAVFLAFTFSFVASPRLWHPIFFFFVFFFFFFLPPLFFLSAIS